MTSKSMKSHKKTKKSKKTQSQRENDLRPKLVPTTLAVMGILSSCPRMMTMQCWKSQIPPPLSTRLRIVYCIFIFWFCADQKEKKHDSAKFSSKRKTQRQVKNTHFTIIPNPQKSQNIKMTTQNFKITSKSMKSHKKTKKQKKHKVKGKTT